MDKYTIYCTPEQTKKAFELGAPIEANKDYSNGNLPETLCVYGDIIKKDAYGIGECTILHIPTTEQMIGWLEKQRNFIDVIRQENDTWLYIVYPENHSNKNITVKGFSSRKEATLAAIDAALEYLTNNKK